MATTLGGFSVTEPYPLLLFTAPEGPGVYVILGRRLSGDRVVYVGQTNNLRERLRSHDVADWSRAAGTSNLWVSIHSLTACDSESYRRLVEASLINQFHPPCNHTDPLPLMFRHNGEGQRSRAKGTLAELAFARRTPPAPRPSLWSLLGSAASESPPSTLLGLLPPPTDPKPSLSSLVLLSSLLRSK